MTFRQTVKKNFFGRLGNFPYFGVKIFFPKNSFVFNLACEQGVYEHENIKLLISLIRPGTTYFDIGANIGLMAVPILGSCQECRVLSFEPSPNALPYLQKTAQNSDFNDRWKVVGKAVGKTVGAIDFCIAPEDMGAFDGMRNTNRVETTNTVSVPITTLDAEWAALGSPDVSVIKIDVEGAELDALNGALECIRHTKPFILVEWNFANVFAYDNQPGDLLAFAAQIGYKVFSVPNLVLVEDATTLEVQMLKTEDFLLAPAKERS